MGKLIRLQLFDENLLIERMVFFVEIVFHFGKKILRLQILRGNFRNYFVEREMIDDVLFDQLDGLFSISFLSVRLISNHYGYFDFVGSQRIVMD